jgi:hypothetical protein
MAAWENVRSREVAEAMRLDGSLEPVLLMPAELGGTLDVANVVLVPPAARAERDRVVSQLLEVFRSGAADQLSVSPEYRGDSFVPASLVVAAWRQGLAPAFQHRIEVW